MSWTTLLSSFCLLKKPLFVYRARSQVNGTSRCTVRRTVKTVWYERYGTQQKYSVPQADLPTSAGKLQTARLVYYHMILLSSLCSSRPQDKSKYLLILFQLNHHGAPPTTHPLLAAISFSSSSRLISILGKLQEVIYGWTACLPYNSSQFFCCYTEFPKTFKCRSWLHGGLCKKL